MTKTKPDTFTLVGAAPVKLMGGGGDDSGDGRRRFEMVAYTGAVFDVGFGPAVIELEGLSVHEGGIPILLDHDPVRFLGRSKTVTVDGSQLLVSGFLFDDVEAKRVGSLSDQGAQWQSSVGIGIDFARVEFVSEGEHATANGQTVTGPFLHLKSTTLKETSFVPMGADSSTSAIALSDFTFQPIEPKEGGMPDPQTAPSPTKVTASVAELRSAFPGDDAYALDCVDKGLTLIEAQAGYAVNLREKLAAQATENEAAVAKLKADYAAASKPNPAAALSTGTSTGAPPAGSDPIADWQAALSAEIVALNAAGSRGANRGLKLSAAAAIRAKAADNVAKKNKAMHVAYLDAVNASGSN